MAKVTKNSTKAEILDKLNETTDHNAFLQKKLDEAIKAHRAEKRKNGTDNKKNEIRLVKEQEILKTVDPKAVDEIPKIIRDSWEGCRESLDKLLSDLQGKIQVEQEKYNNLVAAREIITRELEELHSIKKEAETFEALIIAQRKVEEDHEQLMADKKAKFEVEMAETREKWSREKEKAQEEHDDFVAELERQQTLLDKEQTTKNKQAQETWDYNFRISKRNAQDELAVIKATQEKDLAEVKEIQEKELNERFAKLRTQENEVADLKQQVEGFPKEKASAVSKAEAIIKATLERNHKFEIEKLAAAHEAHTAVLNQQVQDSKTRIEFMNTQIAEQKSDIKELTAMVKDVSVNAVTSASKKSFTINTGTDSK